MKRKLFPLFLFSTSLLMGLVGCDETPVVPEIPEEPEAPEVDPLHPYSFAPTSLDVSKKKISLGVGEETSFITRISPVIAYDAKLVYESDNTAVATVSEAGVIKGVAIGNANITVKYEKNHNISHVVPVSVFNRLGAKSEDLTTAVSNMLAAQGELEEIDTVHMSEYRDYYVLKDGVKVYNSIEYTNTYESKSNAFFYYGWHEDTMKVAGGNFEPSDGAWIINTDKGFDTHVYHVSGTTKTTLVVPTQSYMDTGTRIDCVQKLLSTLFRDADELFNEAYEDALSTKDLGEEFTNFRHLVTGGYVGENVVGYSLTQNGYHETVKPEDESDYNIPAGTDTILDITLHYTWRNALMVTMEIIQSQSYDLDGSHYSVVAEIYRSFETSNVNLPYPVESEYREVENLYDL